MLRTHFLSTFIAKRTLQMSLQTRLKAELKTLPTSAISNAMARPAQHTLNSQDTHQSRIVFSFNDTFST